MKTLKHEIFRRTLFVIISMILFFGLTSSYFFYVTEKKNIQLFIETKNSELANFINAYFIKMYNAVEYLSRVEEVRNAIYRKEKARKKVLELFRIFEQIDPDINYIYAGYKNGLLLINNYVPPPGFNPVVRPWYQVALKSFPHISQGLPYQEIKTKEWLISISKALVDDRGEIVGVVSIDTALDKILNKLNENENLSSLSNIILKKNGTIIVCNNRLAIGGNFFDKYHVNKKRLQKKSGYFTYEQNGHKRYAFFKKLDKLEWILVTSVDAHEIFLPIFLKTVAILLIVSLFSIILGLYFSQLFSSEIVMALNTIQNNIYAMLEGKPEKIKKRKLTLDEFDEIEKNIEKLTNDALLRKNSELHKLNMLLREMALKDALTGLYNRYKMIEDIEHQIARYKRYKEPFCLIMLDIDHFKQINDTYGHDIGDKVLKESAKILHTVIRSSDVAARWGGEEFMILCPNTHLKEGVAIANRLKDAFEKHNFGIDRRVTVSAGVVEYRNENEDMKTVLKRVDERLYQAKRAGRNRVVYEENERSEK
ncbi:sensor domain-containing diguanylate cyclase [Nitratiruptor sp. SB155-2]|uniref:sensor domain-containing diguanylate cyclase n=1 Tax=Nitratiruptor sp. (strain SB155-2) TaxID=387092 RepID=UPI0001586D46|nr:sensor domain-containing diguanylate cyclase [Nitratiruptor sp. SB155-2]BAF69664.1 conserved hypothetical protein [Nitratiruptor sp. SB155-2]